MKKYSKGDKVLYNGKTMTVTEVKPKGWTDNVVVSDGTDSFEINEYDCVYAPSQTIKEEAHMLYDYLLKNGIYTDIDTDSRHTCIHIEWGDWKHDHGFADYLMSLIGYIRTGTRVTADNGSDCYSATHIYLKPVA